MTTLDTSSICVGRQPIYDAARNIVAYEVLYRTPQSDRAVFEDGDVATARVLVNILTEIGLEKTCGSRPVFVNCTRYFLEHEPLIPPDRCVLEVLEDIHVDDALVKSVRILKQRGYRIALDDFVERDGWEPLVELADYIKIDVREHSAPELSRAVERMNGSDAVMLAEKVESEQEFEYCKSLGFDLFQGYYLRRPELITARPAPTSKLALLNLSQQLMSAEADFQEISRSIGGDLSLSYRLLRLVNSAMTTRRAQVESIPHAVAIVGTDMLGRWMAMLGMLQIEDCPSDYVELALQRARTCEMVCQRQWDGHAQEGYIVGLLSLLDSMLKTPWSEVLPSLPLRQDIADALENREGDLGRLIRWVESFEEGVLSPDGPEPAFLQAAFWQGAAYARDMVRSLKRLGK
jgi:c-di-GMP phosphodiesterase